jgi:anti-sigma regulatory factor (Ser/Thr protein kinase)
MMQHSTAGESFIMSQQDRLVFLLKNRMSELDTLCNKLNEFGNAIGMSKKCLFQINLALDELFSNIVSYGFTNSDEKKISFDIFQNDSVLTIRVEDDGVPFDPFNTEKTDVKCSLDEREIGGLGLLLIRKMMDEVNYTRKANKNIVTLNKKLDRV